MLYRGTTDGDEDLVPQSQNDVILATFDHEGTLTTGTGSKRVPVPFAVRDIRIRAMVSTAPTGAAITFDVNKNGTSLGGTLDIATSATDSGEETPTTTTAAAGDYLTCDVDQVGSTVAGADLVVVVYAKAS